MRTYFLWWLYNEKNAKECEDEHEGVDDCDDAHDCEDVLLENVKESETVLYP